MLILVQYLIFVRSIILGVIEDSSSKAKLLIRMSIKTYVSVYKHGVDQCSAITRNIAEASEENLVEALTLSRQ